jgi:hypothetical protein
MVESVFLFRFSKAPFAKEKKPAPFNGGRVDDNDRGCFDHDSSHGVFRNLRLATPGGERIHRTKGASMRGVRVGCPRTPRRLSYGWNVPRSFGSIAVCPFGKDTTTAGREKRAAMTTTTKTFLRIIHPATPDYRHSFFFRVYYEFTVLFGPFFALVNEQK